MATTKEAARNAAKAINAYLAGRNNSARVETLEALDGQHGTLWLAHLQIRKAATFHARVFEIDARGAHPAPGHYFGEFDLYPEVQAEPALATEQEGGEA